MPKREAPANTYWRGGVLWGRIKVKGEEIRWSLRTSNEEVAVRKVAAERKRLSEQVHDGHLVHTWESVFAAWSEHITHEVSASTVLRYAVSLKQLEQWLLPLSMGEITKAKITEIVEGRRARGVTNATIRRDLTALSSVLSFAEGEDWRDDNPALARLARMKERRDPIVLPELEHIEMVVQRAPGNFAKMIEAALLTGCRQSELVTAERTRVDHVRKQLTVIGKGNKLRVMKLSDEAYRLIASVPAALATKTLFWHSGGAPYRNVASRFAGFVSAAQKGAQASGLDFRPFTFHHLRHRYAVDFLKGGGNIYDLQKHLGHTSVKTTEMYLTYLTADEARVAKYGVAQ